MFRNTNNSTYSVASSSSRTSQPLLSQQQLQQQQSHNKGNHFSYVVSEKDNGYLHTSLNVLNNVNAKKKRTVHQQKFHEFNELQRQQQPQQKYQHQQRVNPHLGYQQQYPSLPHNNSLTAKDANAFYQQQLQQQQQIIHQYNQQQQQQHVRSPPLSASSTTHSFSNNNNRNQFGQSRLSVSTALSTATIDGLSTMDRDELIERLITENNGLHQQLEENELEMARLFQENESLKLEGTTSGLKKADLLNFDSPMESSSRGSLFTSGEGEDWLGPSDSVPTQLSSFSYSLDPKKPAATAYVDNSEEYEDCDDDSVIEEGEEEEEEEGDVTAVVESNLTIEEPIKSEHLKDEIKSQTLEMPSESTTPSIIPQVQVQESTYIKPTEDLVNDLLDTIRQLKINNAHIAGEKSILHQKLDCSKKIIIKLSKDAAGELKLKRNVRNGGGVGFDLLRYGSNSSEEDVIL